jgi:polyketide cyclase/dehydrase/lipid transport protein
VAIKKLSGRAARSIAAEPARCLGALRDVDHWPEWLSMIHSVQVEEGPALVTARMLALPLVFVAEVTTDGSSEVLIRRLPQEGTDPERLEIRVQVAPESGGCRASVEISAELDVPRLLPLPGAVGDQLATRLLTDLDRRAAG